MPSLSASQVDSFSIIALLFSAALVILALFRRSPRFAFISWVVVLCFVPYWFSVSIVLPFAPTTAAAGFVLLSMLPIHSFRMNWADLAVVVMIVSYAVSFVIGTGNVSSGWVLASHWLVGYTLGRTILLRLDREFVYRTLTLVFLAVATFAIVEFITRWNPFVLFPVPGRLYDTWGSLLARGGIIRAEGAFGHPIALGVSIALVIPLVFATRLHVTWKLAIVGVMFVATVLTFSRTAMICSVAAAVLSLILLRDSGALRVRLVAGAALVAVGAVMVPFIGSVFNRAGDEATGSAAYRGELFSLVEEIAVVGLSPAFRPSEDGSSFGGFGSIDNQILLIGLLYGLVPLLSVLALLVAACVTLVRNRATAPIISIVAQIPAFLTVAFITQYGMFVWVMAGLAVSSELLDDQSPLSRELPDLSDQVATRVRAKG